MTDFDKIWLSDGSGSSGHCQVYILWCEVNTFLVFANQNFVFIHFNACFVHFKDCNHFVLLPDSSRCMIWTGLLSICHGVKVGRVGCAQTR